MARQTKELPVSQGPTSVTNVTFGIQISVYHKDTQVAAIKPVLNARNYLLEFTEDSGFASMNGCHETVQAAQDAATKYLVAPVAA